MEDIYTYFKTITFYVYYIVLYFTHMHTHTHTGLEIKCPLNGCVFKVWSPGQQCSEVGLWGSDWIMRALMTLSSSMDLSIGGVKL
jgi:hypothetical protein